MPAPPPDAATRVPASGSAPRRVLEVLPLLTSHLVVALVALVGIGGATRVLQAGLACPDWPLCYGVLFPGGRMNLQVFLEWFHRLDAFFVGVALLVLAGLTLGHRSLLPRWLPWAAAGALGLVALQGALGALTVTGLLAAPTVTAHLAVALVLVGLLSATHQGVALALGDPPSAGAPAPVRPPLGWHVLAVTTGLLLLGQCLLGGVMATHWAVERCFSGGEGCHWLLWHRLGARPAALSLLLLAASTLALPAGHRLLKGLVLSALALVALQITLGLLTLRLQLAAPALTVAHQLVAALLIAVLGAVWGYALAAPARCSNPLAAPSLEVIHG